MLEPQASRFWHATLHSGLMDVESLTDCWNAIPPAKRGELEHIDRRLARQAVQSKGLTIWQAQQLLAGRTAGFKVDRYILLDLIGHGGMGRVYLAMDSRLNRKVALKILSPERINNPRAIARFQREARVGAQLQHENLVRIYDFGESNGRFFLVMEFIEGKTIGTLIAEQGPMPPATAVRLLQQVAMGLEHVHRKGLIHRDVNPYNILVTHDGTAKLADLGLALDLAEDDRVTREGATVGTFDYVAPEQARHSHSADIRSDIYSLGCTLHHMLSGQVPFPSPSLPEKLFSHQALEAMPLNQLIPGLPKGLTEVVQRMMRKSPEERYPTPLQVAQALVPFVEEGAGPENGERKAHYLPDPGVRPVPQSNDAGPRLEGESALADGADPTAPVLGPVNAVNKTEGRDPFMLDLGPAPLLGKAVSGSKSRSRSDQSASVVDRLMVLTWLRGKWFWCIFALALATIVLVMTVPTVNSLPHPRPRPPAPNPDPNPVPRGGPQFAVIMEGENEKEIPFDDLMEAMKAAMGSRGWVELRNRTPVRLRGDQILDFRTGSGSLRVRAAPGIKPVIETELKSSKPLLTTGLAVPLELSGVTIVVRYPAPAPAGAPAPPAVITAAGAVKIDRCAFRVEGGLRLKDSRAISSNGGRLEVDRCWFEGFDNAIELSALYQAPNQIRQTMIVAAPGQTQEQLPELYGWGVKLKSARNGGAQPHLILEHCTIEGAGLLDLVTNRGIGPLHVVVMDCIVRANALLACKPSTRSTEQIKEQISWLGESNQYAILGHSWIVLSASPEGTPAFSTDVADLDSWLRVATKENNPIRKELKFLVDPKARSTPLQPGDFALAESGPGQIKPGADPVKVGPWRNP
jgi:serine/threonine protein kinase